MLRLKSGTIKTTHAKKVGVGVIFPTLASKTDPSSPPAPPPMLYSHVKTNIYFTNHNASEVTTVVG